MARRDDDPPEADPEEGPVLAPEELEITEDEHVTEIDDGRFVVSPEARSPADPVGAADVGQPPADEKQAPTADEPAPTTQSLDRRTVHEWLESDFEDATARYGFDVTAKFDGEVSQRRLASDDVVTAFESLVLWYAQYLDADTPVEQVLGILLSESNVPVRYPARSLSRLVESTDLEPDDSIAELLAAVDARDGLQL